MDFAMSLGHEQLKAVWAYLTTNYTEWQLTTVGILVWHEIAYFLAYLPYFIADFIPAARKYKIQQKHVNSWAEIWNCFKYLMFLHFCVQFPIMLASHPILSLFNMKSDVESVPTVPSLIVQCVVFFFVEDFYFYWVHRFMHWGPFYKYVHKVHHEHHAPFGIAGEYAHPAETIFLGLGSVSGPILCAMVGKMHLITLFVWLFVRLAQVIEVHSGYDFPFSLNNLLPLWGGAEFHDHHHMAFTGNYSSTFYLWDWVFGTDKEYLAYKHNLAEAKSKLKKLQ